MQISKRVNKKYFIFSFVIFFVFLFSSCDEEKTTKKKTVIKKSVKKVEKEKVSNQIKKEKIKVEKEKIKKEQNFDNAYKNGWAFLKKAYLHGDPGADEIARMWFERAVQLCPKCPKPYFHIMGIYSFQRKGDKVYEWKEKAINNLGADVVKNYKYTFHTTRDSEASKREIRWAKENYIIWNELGEKKFFLRVEYFRKKREYLNQGDFDKAIDACKKAIEIYPKSTQGYFWLSSIYGIHLNFEEKEIEVLHKALKINPYVGEIYIKLSEAYTGIRKYDKAITALQKALELDLDEKDVEEVKTRIKSLKTLKKTREILTK